MAFSLKAVLSVAGSDSSGGAGIQADIKTIAAHGLFAETAITALTAQNTLGVTGVANVDPAFVADQIDAVFDDIRPDAVKVGMVSSVAIMQAVAERLSAHGARNVVVDPVMVATSGARLIDEDAVAALRAHLLPLADLVTPNIPEGRGAVRVRHRRRGRDGARRPPAARSVRRGGARERRPWRERRERRAGLVRRARFGGFAAPPSTRRTPTARVARCRPPSPASLQRERAWPKPWRMRRRTSPERSPPALASAAAAAPSITCGTTSSGRRGRPQDPLVLLPASVSLRFDGAGRARPHASNTHRPPVNVASTRVFCTSSGAHESTSRSSTATSASMPASSVPSSCARPTEAALPWV